MFSGIVRQLLVAVAAVVILISAAFLPGRTATADPDQDQKFFDLLGQKDIPPVDNANSLIETARKACSKLDGGMSVGDLVDLIRNNGYNENPLTRLNPADRITRTINQFIIASVEAYCPYDRGKIASIAAYRTDPSGEPAYRVAAYTHRAVLPQGLILTSVIGTVPAGDIAPTKPLPVPAAPPPPEAPAPAPQQPPPPPRHVQQAPQRQPQVAPPAQEPPPPPQEAPPQEAPPQEAPPQAEQPQAPAPAPAPGNGNGAAPAPEPPPPAPPAPPGHIRLAP